MPDSVSITAGRADRQSTTRTPAEYPPFGADKVSSTPDFPEPFKVNGDLLNPYSKEVKSVAVTAVLRDADGKVVGGGTSFIDGLPAMGSRPFSFTARLYSGRPSSVEIYAMPWDSAGWASLVRP